MSIYKGSKLVAGSSTNAISDIIKLFKHDWYDYSFSDLSWVRADDFEWIYADRYPIAYEHLYADFISTSTWQSETIGSYTIQFKIAPDGHRITDHANEGTVQNIYGESGVAWYYIIDTVNERFKLPRTKHGIIGLRDEVGKYVAPGVPNITGQYTVFATYGEGLSSGALNASFDGTTKSPNNISGTGDMTVSIDASRSSSIYGNSTTVQPPATQQYLYFYLGQFPVSALVNPDIAATKVNTSMDNLNSVGRNIANWSSNITNCITEIPQDIKLELADGTLTLKAGSKVYDENGVWKIIQSDMSVRWDHTGSGFIIVSNNYGLTISSTGSETVSALPTPSTSYKLFYNTSDKKCYFDVNNTAMEKTSFPIATFTANGSITSIDQIFNGFGYIGSTVFALPGVKGLIPNGRNEDETLKNIEFTNNTVLTWDKIDNKINDWFFESNNANIPMRGWGSTDVYHFVNSPVTSTYSWSYVVPENQWYYCNASGVLNKAYPLFFGKDTSTTTTISGFKTNTPFHALDYNDFQRLDDEAVKTTSDQDIDGHKRFKQGVDLKAPYTYGTPPTSNTYRGVNVRDANNDNCSGVEFLYKPDGSCVQQLMAKRQDKTANYAKFGVGFDANQNEVVEATAGVKQAIIGWGMPDYSTSVSFSTGSNYTVPKDGIVVWNGSNSDQHSLTIKINNTTIMTYANNAGYDAFVGFLPVRKGDVVLISIGTQGSSTNKFYPLKGA